VRFSELLATPGVIERSELRSTFGVMAFHGGNLERVTDEIAQIVADRTGASLYVVAQVHPVREHISSSKVLRSESARLDAFLSHVQTTVALHGYGREGFWTSTLLGGTNRGLAAHLARTLDKHLPEFNAIDDLDAIPSELRGLHRDNPVNVPKYGGVQIELPPRVRGLTPHAASMPRTDGFIAWTHRLVDALVEAIDTRPAAGRAPSIT
jgi:phage replication-related protein YjqB (UPF0714/DUF867 family)